MKARFKYRIYATSEQKNLLAKLFSCVRVVWNDSLACCQEKYKLGEKKPYLSELQKLFIITRAKKTEDREWLSDVSVVPLQQSFNDLNHADQNFFSSTKGNEIKTAKPPKFQSRKSKQTARFTVRGFQVYQDPVYLAKIGKLKVAWSRPLPNQPSSVTVIKDSANRYFLNFVVEVNPETLPQTDNSVGIDLGIKTFATLSNCVKIDALKSLKKRIKKSRKLSKSLSKKKPGSKRYEKVRLRRDKFHAKLKDTRTDFLHKLSTEIINENHRGAVLKDVSATCIVLENLNVSGLVKNRNPPPCPPGRGARGVGI